MNDDKPKSRRDMLTTAAFWMAGLGATVAMWPLISALGPAGDDRARRVIFNLSDLNGYEASIVEVGRRTIMVFKRTPQQLAALRNPPKPIGERAHDAKILDGADNWHRSLRAEIAVLNITCTKGDCAVRPEPPDSDELLCSCCASRYDLAGRILSGPAPSNLIVPPHEYVGDDAIAFFQPAPIVAGLTLSRANPQAPFRS